MQPNQFADDYKVFPYRQDYENGRSNNGGIDLLLEPERLGEITEAVDFPELRAFIVATNGPASAYWTLGCEAGRDGDVFAGYVQFSYRDESLAGNEAHVAQLDHVFMDWATRTQSPEVVTAIPAYLRWEYFWFSYHGSRRLAITVWYRARSRVDAGHLLGLLQSFLLNT